MKYLDFENEKYEKGYQEFKLTPENIKNNIGKSIVYVTSRDVDSRRGYVFPKHAIICGITRNKLLINDGDDTISIKSIIECGIKI